MFTEAAFRTWTELIQRGCLWQVSEPVATDRVLPAGPMVRQWSEPHVRMLLLFWTEQLTEGRIQDAKRGATHREHIDRDVKFEKGRDSRAFADEGRRAECWCAVNSAAEFICSLFLLPPARCHTSSECSRDFPVIVDASDSDHSLLGFSYVWKGQSGKCPDTIGPTFSRVHVWKQLNLHVISYFSYL